MITIILVYFILFLLLLWSLYKLIEARVSPLVKIPGYALYNPIFGNVLFLGSKSIFERWALNYKTFGTIYRWYTLMGHTFITVSSPDYLKQVLTTNGKNYVRSNLVGAEIFRKIVGDDSMLLIDGEKHRNHRSIVSPAFRIANLRKLIPIMQKCATRLCNHFDDLLDKKNSKRLDAVDIRLHLSHVTLTVIGLAGFGHDFDCIDKPNRLAEGVSSLTVTRTSLSVLTMLPYAHRYPIPAVQNIWSSLRTVRSIIDDLIASKRRTKFDQPRYTDKDLLDMILERTDNDKDADKNDSKISLENSLSQRELRDEVMTFIMAGHETSSLALTWTIAMLCLHQNWQEKCRQEIESLFLNVNEISWDHFDQLKLTRAVVNETLRLWPPVPALLRRAAQEDYIGQYKIPIGTSVVTLIGQMHRLPDYWRNPLEFMPERFLEEDVPWDAFMPFGDGVHKCLGYQFAVSEILTVLVTLLKKYRFQLAIDWKKQQVHGYVTLQPTTPILVDLIPV